METFKKINNLKYLFSLINNSNESTNKEKDLLYSEVIKIANELNIYKVAEKKN